MRQIVLGFVLMFATSVWADTWDITDTVVLHGVNGTEDTCNFSFDFSYIPYYPAPDMAPNFVFGYVAAIYNFQDTNSGGLCP